MKWKIHGYKAALLQAINQIMLEKENFLGSVEKNEKGYYIMQDMSQRLAILKHEKQQEEKLNKQGEER